MKPKHRIGKAAAAGPPAINVEAVTAQALNFQIWRASPARTRPQISATQKKRRRRRHQQRSQSRQALLCTRPASREDKCGPEILGSNRELGRGSFGRAGTDWDCPAGEPLIRRGGRKRCPLKFCSSASISPNPPQGGDGDRWWLIAKLKMSWCAVQTKAVGPKLKAPAKAPPARAAKQGAAALRMIQVTECLSRHLSSYHIYQPVRSDGQSGLMMLGSILIISRADCCSR